MKLSVISIFKLGDLRELERTVNSIQSQTIPVWETIFVVSGVHDQAELRFLNDLSRVKIYVNVDKSLYNAMNIGLSAATGDAVIFLNGGDEFSSVYSVEYIFKEYKTGVCIGFSVVQYFESDRYLRCAMSTGSKDLILPSHQGFVAPLPHCATVNFQEHIKIAADSLWMKQLIDKYGIILSGNVLSKFKLGGVSNFPSIVTVRVKLESQGVKAAISELMKLILRLIFGRRWYYRVIYFFKYKRI
jgi:glycosyltransferase involved in cell wall biosynthesis